MSRRRRRRRRRRRYEIALEISAWLRACARVEEKL